ncbi:MAG: DNA repair protein RadA [Anaerolineae bacterium]
MAKTQSRYVCQNCGRQSPRYMGRCPSCGEFNTMVEEVTEVVKPGARAAGGERTRIVLPSSRPQRLNEISMEEMRRYYVPIGEFNRVLGGGLVPGSITLIGGEPGIGKSTIILQTAALIANNVGRVLYVSGEESTRQIKMRADRMGLQSENLFLLTETRLSDILEQVNEVDPTVLVIDSIQTIYTEESESSPGSVSQVRECASRLQMLAKTSGISVFLIGHVTKEGAIAGPRVLEHIVDTVLYLEGDPYQAYRLLRSVKNRFGATSEVGVFEMSGVGMVEVPGSRNLHR